MSTIPIDTGYSIFDSVDPMRAIELAGDLLAKVSALADTSDDPMATITLSGDIVAIIAELEDDSVSPELIAARVAAAAVLGTAAFAAGKPAAPAMNPELDTLLADLKVGEGEPILQAFVDAWTAASLAAQVVDDPIPNEPVVDVPDVIPPVAEVSPERADALSFLADVTSASVDMWADSLTDRLEAIAAAYPDDTEVESAVKDAVNSYADYMMKAINPPA